MQSKFNKNTLHKMENINLFELKTTEISELAAFVVSENMKHHRSAKCPRLLESERQTVCDEESRFANSRIFAARSANGTLVGTIRLLKWNRMDLLPIEKLFGISPLDLLASGTPAEVWHLGRFAVSREGNTFGSTLFKILMTLALSEICSSGPSLTLAECDVRLLRTVNLLGIESDVLAPPLHYLGSDTVPVSLHYSSLCRFTRAHRHLLTDSRGNLELVIGSTAAHIPA